MSIGEESKIEFLKRRVVELEKALEEADSEMEAVVCKMNVAQIEVMMDPQNEREEAVRQTRKLQAMIEEERLRNVQEICNFKFLISRAESRHLSRFFQSCCLAFPSFYSALIILYLSASIRILGGDSLNMVGVWSIGRAFGLVPSHLTQARRFPRSPISAGDFSTSHLNTTHKSDLCFTKYS